MQNVSMKWISLILLTLTACSYYDQAQGIPPATVWALQTRLASNSLTMAALSIADTPLPSSTPEPSSTPLPSQTPQPSPIMLLPTDTPLPIEHGGTVQVTIKVTRAKLREGPDLDFPPVGDYIGGDACQVIGQYNDWFLVQCSKGDGWLYFEWVSLPPGIDLSSIPVIARADVPMLCQKDCDNTSNENTRNVELPPDGSLESQPIIVQPIDQQPVDPVLVINGH